MQKFVLTRLLCGVFAASALSAGLIACSPVTGSNESENKSLAQSVTLGIAHCCVEQDVFMWNMAKDVEKVAKAQGVEQLMFETANGDQEKQLAQVEKMVNQGAKAIVSALVIDDTVEKPFQAKLFDTLNKTNTPIVLYTIAPRHAYFAHYPNIYFVGSIPEQSGIYQGQLVVKQWKAHPNWDKNNDGVIQYVILKGAVGNPDAEGRTKWVAATMENYPNEGIKTEKLALQSGNWQRADAKNIIDGWIDSGVLEQTEVIIANNDDMALGAVDSLKAHGLKLPVFGVDAVPDALKLVKSGEMAGTVLQDGKGQAREAVKLAINLAAQRPANTGLDYKVIEQQLSIPYIAIDADNVGEFLK